MRTNTTELNTGREAGSSVRTITGVVRSATGETLPGAHVYYINDAGDAVGEATDTNGAFSFVAPIGATVRATFVGYSPKERQVTTSSEPMIFVLEPGVDLPTFEVVGDGGGNSGTVAAVAGGLLLLLILGNDQ